MSEEDWEMKKRRERGERKQAKANSTPQTVLQRQLGSLSPGSASLLTQLLPSSRPSPVREQEEPQPAFSFSVFSANPARTTPVRVSSPVRASPERRAKPRSPNRVQFQASSLDDPNRTPARRIPMEQAVARGQISPQKGVQLLAKNVDAAVVSRTPIFHIPPQDSPARRVNVTVVPPSASQSKYQGMRFGSPTRGRSRERSGSVEPRPPWNASAATAGPSDLGASASKSRSSPSRSISAPIKKGKLPFPLTPSGSARPASIPEVDDKVLPPDTDAPAPPPASPLLGIIKVPKPYARPAAAAKPTDKNSNSKAAAASTHKAATAREPPSRTNKVTRTGSGSSSDDMKTGEAGPSSLKRKRIPSPTSQRPVVLLRQVPRSTAPKPVPVLAAPISVERPPSPAKRPPVSKFRMVDLHVRPDVESKPPEAEVHPVFEAVSEPELVSLDALRSPPVSSPVRPSEELTSDPAPHPPSLRKSVFPASVGPPQPLPTRRKVSREQPPAGSGVFAGMTAVALKALTSSNTTKNQKYLAAKLETEVVRKEGARPESPAVKIRTIAQREQDEKGMRRKERAARRARRSDDGFSENEGTSDAGDESPMDTDMDSSPVRRHRLGPGDEEEYETPKVNGAKRARADSMSEDGQAEKKRVKWQRGLSTAVYLDEVEPRPNARPKENLVKKGCLAPTAKAIRLDPLGNHPHAESPLKDLVEENIVVKKFVYDNDEPVLPVVVVKNTRSKTKKKS
ncbi:C3H1-type domain-containing protein [Mycena venus]|uniref:C3H1-type domain-containing protein n=1 Tax=Mycena venus TaxID=2733690 RepID=A0A8H6XBM1_9AGAR|nr:C3H1-type domain-containing protein [Mycena venus]